MVNVTILMRRDSAADWTSENPILLEGEIGYETDTRRMKIGDGSTAWSNLNYKSSGPGFIIAASDSSDLNKSKADYICDGVDDQVEIQAAIDELPSEGGKIQLLEGNFNISDRINSIDNLIISGMGYATQLIIGDTTAFTPVIIYSENWYVGIYGDAKENVIIENLYMDFEGDSKSNYENYAGMLFESCSNIIVRNCKVYDVVWGVDIATPKRAHGIAYRQCTNSFIINCLVDHCGYEGIAVRDACNNIYVCKNTLTNNKIHSAQATDWLPDGGDESVPSEKVYFIQNITDKDLISHSSSYVCFSENITTEIRIIGNSNNIMIQGNEITGDVYVGDSGGAVSQRNIVIEGNTFLGDETAINLVANSGLRSDIYSVSIVNNNFRCSGGYKGIEIKTDVSLKSTFYAILIEGNIYNGKAGNMGFIYTEYNIKRMIIKNNIVTNGVHVLKINKGLVDRVIMTGNILRNLTYYEPSGNGSITNLLYSDQHNDIFQDCLALSSNHVVNAEDLSASSPITCTIASQPDVPRTLSWAITHTNITEFTIAFVGVDAKGDTITETVTEADGWSGELNNAFAKVTSITFTRDAGTGAGDTLNVGIADKLGLSNIIYADGDVFKVKENNADYTNFTVDDTYHTVSIDGAIGAGDDYTIWYRTNLNIIG